MKYTMKPFGGDFKFVGFWSPREKNIIFAPHIQQNESISY
jgi:hypothetical protein